MTAYLVRAKRRRDGKVVRSRVWKIRYRLDGAARYRERSLGVRDEQVARSELAKFIRSCELEAAGIVAPPALRLGASTWMLSHLADYLRELEVGRRSSEYVYIVERRVARLIGECVWKLPRDVTDQSFLSWRECNAVKAAKTLNDFLADASGLLNWMARRGRILANPLRSVEKISTAGQDAKRRALSVDELRRLVGVASPGRRVVYLAAVVTGLRRAELGALKWADVHLDAVRPFLRVRASTTKNGKSAHLMLTDELASELRVIRCAAADDAPVFASGVPSMEDFRVDLRLAKVTEVDAIGRVVVFHSLRSTLATSLAAAGVSAAVTKQVMRHSDIGLTMKHYVDQSELPVASAVDALPRCLPGDDGLFLRATGTAGCDPQQGSHGVVVSSPLLSSGVARPLRSRSPESAENQAKRDEMSSAVVGGPVAGESWGTRIRTYTNPRGNAVIQGQDTQKSTQVDPDLAALLAAWPSLSHARRRAIVSLVLGE